MDMNHDSPIVIHSDDDDDDDVVLVEDRSSENDDKKQEDDVIFISEEQPSLSRQKCSPESRKNKRKVAMLSNASRSDVDACNIQCDGYFPSDFSSLSLINDLLRPLDLSHGSTLSSGDLPAEIKCRLNLLKQLQDSCSSVSSPEQDANSSNKSDDDLDDSVKVLHDFDVGSGRNVGDSTFASTSGKLEILAPLKLPESTGPLSSHDLTASVCKIYVEKNCFNLPLTEAKDVAKLASDLVHASSSSSLSCLDKTSFHTMAQDVDANVFDDSANKKNSMLKSITAVSVNSTNYTQSLNASVLCDVNNLGFTSSNSEALTKGICTVVDPLGCLKKINPGQPQDTTSASRNFYIGDAMSKPGTSKQYSNLVSQSASLLDTSDSSSTAQSKASSSDSDSSLNLAFDNLSPEDFSTLLDFFADGDKSQAPSDPAAGSKGSDDPALSLQNNFTDLLGAASDNQASLSCYGDPLDPRSSTSALYDHSYITKLNRKAQDDIDCKLNSGVDYLTKTLQEPSMPDFSTTDYSCLVVKADKAGTEHSSSLDLQRHPSQANISFSSVSGAFRKLLSQRIKALRSKRGAFHINMMNISKKSKSKFQFSNIGINSLHQGTDPAKMLTHDNGILQASDHLNTGAGKVSSGQWQIVRSVPSSTRKRKVNDNLLDSPPSARKKKQGEENLGKEKPSLKIRLKLSHSISGLETNVPAPFRPSNIGLKKSIMKRHASMIGDITGADMKPRAGVHRSASDGGLTEQSEENKIAEVPCGACSKMVNGKKLSQCSKGHGICAACLEPQVKSVLKGDVKQKNITCLFSSCSEIVSFGELKQTFPSLVVDILEEKLDKEYLSYITKWMFTDEQLKSRSEFATLDTKVPPHAASGLKKCDEMDSQEAHEPVEDFPRFWLPMEPGAPVMAFEVIPDTEEYRALACQFHETLSFGDYDIVRIVRIQNPILWKYFSLKQSEMIQEDDGMGVTEKRLYHGTHRSTCEAIARKGFDWRLSGKHGTVYGNGSYFATTSRYSHAYTDRAGSGISVKAGGSSLGSFFQSSTTLTYPGFNSISINQRVMKSSRFTNMTHSALMTSVPPLQLTSSSPQHQPPQPPPAHYHYPAPPPAHGQTSSLQVPAHLPMTNLGSTKDSSMSSTSASCSRNSSCNAPLVKILPKPPTTAPSSTGPPNAVISNSCTHYFNPSNIFCMPPPFAQPHFTSDFQPRTSTTDPSNPSSSQSLNPNGQLVFGGRSSYTAPSMPKPGFSTAASSPFSWRDPINPGGSSQDKPTAIGTSNHKSKYPDGSKSSMSSYLQAPLKGTNDLSSVFACDPSSKTHFMFVARVLVGRHTLGKAGLKRPPPLNENDPYGKCFDSCVDDMFCPQLYVIFDSNQAYPEYVIEYNWHKE